MYNNKKIYTIIMLVLILSIPPHSFAGRFWTNWEEVRGKGVVGCQLSDAKAKARGKCNARLKSNQKVERVELRGFNRETWRDGFLGNERNCAYAADARCLVSTPDSGYDPGTIDYKNETLVINNCARPIFVSNGNSQIKPWTTNTGLYDPYVYRVSKGHWKVNSKSKKAIHGSYLLISSKGKKLTKMQTGFCYHPSKEFKYRILYEQNNNQGNKNRCSNKGGQWYLFEDMRKYSTYTINSCN